MEPESAKLSTKEGTLQFLRESEMQIGMLTHRYGCSSPRFLKSKFKA